MDKRRNIIGYDIGKAIRSHLIRGHHIEFQQQFGKGMKGKSQPEHEMLPNNVIKSL